ncbi:MAG TPA: carbohydrate ABC transporter permease [Rubrobacter sp.]|nr:carbohydrate ABC transporter permease [Rubrobacter sp.]
MAQATVRTESEKSRRSPEQLSRLVLSYSALILLTLVFVTPLLWMLSTSFKTNVEATQIPPNWIPEEFTLENYSTIFSTGESQTPVLRWFLNSMIAASAHTALVLVTASMASYALARMNFPGKSVLFATIITTLFIPTFIFLMPNYLIVDSLGWLDTLWAVIVPGAAGAFGVFFLRQFFLSLPYELEEAALIDGASRIQIFLRIILPLSKAPLATLAVLSFLNNWNDFLWPVYVLFSPRSLVLPPGLSKLQGAYDTDYAVIMAGGVLASIPVIILFIIAQRYIIEGVSRSGLKG